MSDNPYATPQNLEIPESKVSDAETIRRAHLKTEASIKSIGILYWLSAIGILIASAVSFTTAFSGAEFRFLQLAIAIALCALGIFQFIVGFEIRRLKAWARIATGVLSGIGLLGFPVGTLINAYILYLIFGKKGSMVFSDSYKEIIAATPHVKYKTSKVVWILLILVILIILGITFNTLRGK